MLHFETGPGNPARIDKTTLALLQYSYRNQRPFSSVGSRLMHLGYARISTLDQNLDLQRDALTKAGCERIFEDRANGGKNRPHRTEGGAFPCPRRRRHRGLEVGPPRAIDSRPDRYREKSSVAEDWLPQLAGEDRNPESRRQAGLSYLCGHGRI